MMALNPAHNLTKYSAVILEDNPHQVKGMLAELNEATAEVEVLVAGPDPEEILAAVETHRPDVAFIDLHVRREVSVGLSTIQEIKKIAPEVKCVVLTTFPEFENFLRAYDAGAEGFVRKELPLTQKPSLIELIKIVTVGGTYYDRELEEQLRQEVRKSGLSRVNGDELERSPNPLTEREQEILGLLAKPKTNPEIARALVISVHTVKAHIRNIKNKLRVQHRHQAVLVARVNGWLDDSTPNDD